MRYLFLLGFLTGTLFAAPTEKATPEAQLNTLLEQLDSAQFIVRENATEALDGLIAAHPELAVPLSKKKVSLEAQKRVEFVLSTHRIDFPKAIRKAFHTFRSEAEILDMVNLLDGVRANIGKELRAKISEGLKSDLKIVAGVYRDAVTEYFKKRNDSLKQDETRYEIEKEKDLADDGAGSLQLKNGERRWKFTYSGYAILLAMVDSQGNERSAEYDVRKALPPGRFLYNETLAEKLESLPQFSYSLLLAGSILEDSYEFNMKSASDHGVITGTYSGNRMGYVIGRPIFEPFVNYFRDSFPGSLVATSATDEEQKLGAYIGSNDVFSKLWSSFLKF